MIIDEPGNPKDQANTNTDKTVGDGPGPVSVEVVRATVDYGALHTPVHLAVLNSPQNIIGSIPKLIVPRGLRRSRTIGYRARPCTIDAQIRHTSAVEERLDSTCDLWRAIHSRLCARGDGSAAGDLPWYRWMTARCRQWRRRRMV